MAASEHDGIFDSERTYSLRAVARILGIKQERTVRQKLAERGVPIDEWCKGVTLVSGKIIQLAVERNSQCSDCSDD